MLQTMDVYSYGLITMFYLISAHMQTFEYQTVFVFYILF